MFSDVLVIINSTATLVLAAAYISHLKRLHLADIKHRSELAAAHLQLISNLTNRVLELERRQALYPPDPGHYGAPAPWPPSDN